VTVGTLQVQFNVWGGSFRTHVDAEGNAFSMASDYYQLLGLDRTADESLIDKAYRLLARRYHPDQNPSHNDEARFEEIQAAYEVLSSPGLRTKYDQALLEHTNQRRVGVGADVFQMLRLRFDQAARGGRITINRIVDRQIRQIDLQIPRAIEDGARLRVSGQGEPGQTAAGDLILIVAVEPHRRFRRDGLDLFVDVDIPVDVAMLGGRIEVPTLDDHVDVEVPPGTSGGTPLRVRAAGLRNNDNQYGDLFAVIRIKIPRSVSRKAQEMAAGGESESAGAAQPRPDEPAWAQTSSRPEEPVAHESHAELAERQARLDRLAGRLQMRQRRLAGYRAALRQRFRRLEYESRAAGQQRRVLRMHAMLVMLDAEGERRTFPLAKPVTVIGRRAGCDLSIPHTGVSREHCQIEYRDGHLMVRDLGSSNGIQHNQQTVTEAQLAAGDVITVGPIHLQLRLDGEPADRNPPNSRIEDAGSITYSAAAIAAHQDYQTQQRARDQLEQRTADLDRRHDELSESRKQFESQRAELEHERQQLSEQAAALDNQRQTLQQQRKQLDQRAAELEASEQAVQRDRHQLDHDRAELDRRRHELDERSSQLEAHRAELNTLRQQLHDQDTERADDQAERDQLERQRIELVEQRQALDEQKQQLDQRAGQLDDERAELDEARQQVQQQRAELTPQRSQLEREQAELQNERADLDARRQEIAQQHAQLDTQREQLEADRRQLADEREKLAADREALDARARQLESDQARLEAEQAERAEQVVELEKQFTRAERQLQQAERRSESLDAREAEIEQARRALDEQKQAFEQSRQSDQSHEQELTRRAAELDDLQKQLETDRAAVDERQAELDRREDRLTRQLDQLPEHLQRLARQRLAVENLQQELDERQREVDQYLQRIERKQQQADAEQRQLAEAHRQLDARRAELDGQQQQLDDQNARQQQTLEKLAQQQVELESREAELDTLADELDRRRGELDAAEQRQRDREQPSEVLDAEPVQPPEEEHEAEVVEDQAAEVELANLRAAAGTVHFHLDRLGHQPALDLTPSHLRTACGFVDHTGMYHLLVDYVDAAQKTTNTWGAEIRYFRSSTAKTWEWTQTAVGPGSFEAGDGDCFGAASPAVVHVGNRVLMFYAGRGGLSPDQQPRILAPRGEDGYLASRIMLAVAETDSSGAIVSPFTKRGVVVEPGDGWDMLRLDHPAVVLDGQTLHLFYTGYDDARSLDRRKLGYAAANVNDLQFTRRDDPVLEVRGGGEMPRLFRHENQWHLLYHHYAHHEGARWRHYVADKLPHFEPVDPDFFDGVRGETNSLMLFTDTRHRLADDRLALVTSAAGGCWRLFPFQINNR